MRTAYLSLLLALTIATMARAEATPPAKLELSWVDDACLIVKVTNTSKDAIRLDKDLVIGLELTFADANNTRVPLKHLETVKAPEEKEIVKRFVDLPPGQSLERRINLRGGFASFTCGHATEAVTHLHHFFGIETKEALPDDSKATKLIARFGTRGFDFTPGVQSYTGKSMRELQLTEMWLDAQTNLPAPQSK